VARLGVKAFLKGGEPAYEPASHNLVVLFDMDKRMYRAVPLDGVKALRIAGERIRVA
jgi:hypothetical protein